MKEALQSELDTIEEFFLRSTSCLEEADSEFQATEDSLSVAQQVAHVAQSIDWFLDGMTSVAGFDMDFEKHWTDVRPCTSLKEAKKWFQGSIARAKKTIAAMSEDELQKPLPEGPVMGGAPRHVVVGAMSEHTAHHRGALSVYARLLGKTPSMPYMEE